MILRDFLKNPKNEIPGWLYSMLGLLDPAADQRLKPYYDFIIRESHRIAGDIAEFGIFQGCSLLSTSLLLTRLKSRKTVLGFDFFSGFPKPHANDDHRMFDALHRRGAITDEHYRAVGLFREARKHAFYRSWGENRFRDTSLAALKKRIRTFGLTNIRVFPGAFKDALHRVPAATRYAACLLDGDLYCSYRDVLEHCWSKLHPGGFIYMDEYYSLRYPGPRIAVDAFCAKRGISPQRAMGYDRPSEFERWFLRKPF